MSKSAFTVSMLVAMGNDRAIGQANTMPWYLPEDLQHFKQSTLNQYVIMGRRTFESIGRPLPKRRNIVISSKMSPLEGIEVVGSLEQALELASNTQSQENLYSKIVLIGGVRVFEAGLDIADELIVTEINARFPDADTFFPELSSKWQLASCEPDKGEYLHSLAEQKTEFRQLKEYEQGLQYRFVRYVRSAS